MTTTGFHFPGDGDLRIHYYDQVMRHTGAFGYPLMEELIAQLDSIVSRESETKRLAVLRKSLAWHN